MVGEWIKRWPSAALEGFRGIGGCREVSEQVCNLLPMGLEWDVYGDRILGTYRSKCGVHDARPVWEDDGA